MGWIVLVWAGYGSLRGGWLYGSCEFLVSGLWVVPGGFLVFCFLELIYYKFVFLFGV